MDTNFLCHLGKSLPRWSRLSILRTQLYSYTWLSSHMLESQDKESSLDSWSKHQSHSWWLHSMMYSFLNGSTVKYHHIYKLELQQMDWGAEKTFSHSCLDSQLCSPFPKALKITKWLNSLSSEKMLLFKFSPCVFPCVAPVVLAISLHIQVLWRRQGSTANTLTY